MAKIKHTKTELKSQRDALSRFERFLPMLQLKKQQLQVEVQLVDTQLRGKQEEEKTLLDHVNTWVSLFAEPIDVAAMVRVEAIEIEEGNIAGVAIPVLQDVRMRLEPYDLFETPPWIDDGVESAGNLMRLRIEREVLEEQLRRIEEELRITNQRVNLFEKVKIPECRENIRVIKIFLGDEQTAAVARGKLAKKRTAA